MFGTVKEGSYLEVRGVVQWETPDEYLDAARELMGGIDIDPASTDKAQQRIRAKVYYTKSTNGLDKPWYGRLWLNSPYDPGIIEQFTGKAIKEYVEGRVTEGLVLTHTNNTHNEYFQHLLSYSSGVCFVHDYIRWTSGHAEEEVKINRMGIAWHPEYTKHGNAVFYLGSKAQEFKRIFSKFGVCLCPMKS